VEWVIYSRRLCVPREEVWSSLTDPARLARWIGTFRGDPGSGLVDVYFTAEGEDLLPQTYRIERVVPGHELVVTTSNPGEREEWRLRVRLLDADGGTLVRVAQAMANLALAPSVAAGCEFYLDRMIATFEGRDPDDLDFDEYFVAQSGHYRQMFPVQVRRGD
jgi:uncharacterized protein YndB with AHSA1/START domain